MGGVAHRAAVGDRADAAAGGHGNYLHDGRARSLLEAILWHGGEARAQRDAVVALDPGARNQLLTFIESL